jgi:ATP-binding cassette subfamily B protein
VAYLLIGLRALSGMYTLGQVTQFVGAIVNFSNALTEMTNFISHLWENAKYLPKVFEYLDLPVHGSTAAMLARHGCRASRKVQGSTAAMSDRKHTGDKQPAAGVIEFHDVSFKYPAASEYALKHLNLTIYTGKRLAVVGMNGSGKTTMIKLLTRLYEPTEGRITLNGEDIKNYDYAAYLNLFAVVFQDFKLPSLPLGENVAASSAYDAKRVTQCLSEMGAKEMPLATILYKDFDKDGVNISGGEAQKIALARAIYKDAPFVVLDEPTAALDPIAESEVYSKFDVIAEKSDDAQKSTLTSYNGGDARTAVYISHRLSSCRFCDKVAVFDSGELVQMGGHDDLLQSNGKYAQLWNAQAQYYVS